MWQDDSIDGEEEKNEDLPPAVKDMASQAERVNAKARIAEEQVCIQLIFLRTSTVRAMAS